MNNTHQHTAHHMIGYRHGLLNTNALPPTNMTTNQAADYFAGLAVGMAA